MQRNSPTAPRRVRATERRAKAVELRCSGMTFDAVGKALGISGVSARALVMKALQEDADIIEARRPELRALEQRRLDEAAAAIWDQVKSGDVRAQDTYLRNRQRYAALLGLDLKPPDVTVDQSQNVIVLPAWGEQPATVDGEARELGSGSGKESDDGS